MLPSCFSTWGAKGDARGGARAAGVEPVLVGIEVWGVIAVRGSVGEILRANLGGEVDESVIVFVGCAALVGSFLCESCFKFC